MLASVIPPNSIKEMIAVAQKVPQGAFVEVGVYQGGSAQHLTKIAQSRNTPIYLYDTFTGIPFQDTVDFHKVGDFNKTDFEKVKNDLPYAQVIQGIFPQSAVPMEKISFVHIDCDQYRSIKESVLYLQPLMVKGGVIWFDDYELAGAAQAIHELYGDNFTKTLHNRVYVVV